MKNFLFKSYFKLAIVLMLSAGFASCSYDDDDLWNSIENLEKFDAKIVLPTEEQKIVYGDKLELKIEITGIESFTISKPDGWKVQLAEKTLTITAPSLDNSFAEEAGTISIIGMDKNNKSIIAKLNVSAIYKTTVITFEDEAGSTYWSSLIDNPQYNGDLLYGKFATTYEWLDSESGLYSTLNETYGKAFWSGGIAISNYVSTDSKANGSFMEQLTVYGTGGNNGSKNFAVSFGYFDNSGLTSKEGMPRVKFNDGVAKTVDHLYIAPTTYFYNVAVNGNELSPAVGEDEDVWITATGFLKGKEGKTATTYMIKKGKLVVDKWTKWSLAELGKVDEIHFNMGGGTGNGYGFSIPAYFAMDDIMIVYN